jgi:hypothetical protein
MNKTEQIVNKVVEIINNAQSLRYSKGYAPCGVIHVTSVGNLELENYNGGYKVCFNGETLMHTHGVAHQTRAIEDAIDNKEKEMKNKALNELLRS